MDKKIQDICNGEINLGSTLKDILGVLQGEWCDTEKNEWELIKLGSKFSIATRTVKSGEQYILPVETTKPVTAILYLGDGETTSGLIKLKQESVKAPISGVAIIFL